MTPNEQLTVDLWLLDAVLTGKDSRSGRGGVEKFEDIDTWALGGSEAIFYLSDGGYSRVYSPSESGTIQLASESLCRVKHNWDNQPSVATIRTRIERLLQQRLAELAQ